MKPKPLDPPATEAELNRASQLWTTASDNLVARGYQRHLWDMIAWPAKELVILIIRQTTAQK